MIDNALSPLVAQLLRQAGHDATHVKDYNMETATDEDIFDLAGSEQRILASADTDFANLLALRHQSSPSLILFRRPSQRRPSDQAMLLLANLDTVADDLSAGCVVVIEESRLRVRKLPIGDDERPDVTP